MTQTDITRPSLLAELPSAPWFASVLAEKQRLDLLTVQEMHDRSLTVEYPDAIERILASVPRDRIKWLSRPVGVFRCEFPSGMPDEEVQAAIFRAAALGREKTVIGTTAQFEIQKRFWILAAACARQSAACCRYVADLSKRQAQALSESGFGESAAGHMVSLCPMTLRLQPNKDHESRIRVRQAWKKAIQEMSSNRPRRKTFCEFDCSLLGGLSPRGPKVNKLSHSLKANSPEVEFFAWMMLSQVSRATVKTLLGMVLPQEQAEACVCRLVRRYQGSLRLKPVRRLYLSPAKHQAVKELSMRLLCRALDDGFETLDALALIPYAVVHAVWAIGIDPSVLGSAAWMDWLGRQMKDELYRLCEAGE